MDRCKLRNLFANKYLYLCIFDIRLQQLDGYLYNTLSLEGGPVLPPAAPEGACEVEADARIFDRHVSPAQGIHTARQWPELIPEKQGFVKLNVTGSLQTCPGRKLGLTMHRTESQPVGGSKRATQTDHPGGG